MKESNQIRKALKRQFQAKQDLIDARPGQLGDGFGHINVTGRDHYVYVRVAGIVDEVFNNRVPPENDLLVIVGFDPTQPNLYQVLSTRTAAPGGLNGGAISGYAPAIRYQWMATGGGQDPLFVEKRQFLPRRIGPYSGMLIQVYRDIIWTGTAWAIVNTQTIDLTAHIPATTGKCALVLITLDDSGNVIATKGSEVDISTLAITDVPAVPAGTREVLGAVRVYYGQTAVQEARTNTDIIDLRFSGWGSMVTLANHDHSGDAGDGGTFDAANLTSGASTDGQVLTSDGVGGSAWEDATGGNGVPVLLEYSEADISNPPTENELISAFGSPSTDQRGKGYIVNDAGNANNFYLCLADGGHWWYLPFSRTVTVGPPTVTVGSSATIASATGQWFGRAAVKVIPPVSSDPNVNGVVILVYKESTAHQYNDGALHIRFSDNYGVTWSDEDKTLTGTSVTGFPMNPPDCVAGEDAGEGWLYIAPNSDLLLHMWRVNYGVTANGTYQSRSTDGGETWSTPAAVDFTGIADDAKVFATDDDFVYNGVIYAGARVYDNATPSNSKNILIKSDDNGTTWDYVSDISNFTTDTIEVGLEYLGNNTILAILRDMNNTYTYKATSMDMGATWSSLSDVTATLTASGRHRIYTRSHLRGGANWWQDPVLIMVGFQLMSPGNSQQRRNAVWISMDQGATWTGPLYLDTQSEDAGYGDIFYDPDLDRYVVINYQGTLDAAVVKQYNLIIGGI